jgi:cytochrome P450
MKRLALRHFTRSNDVAIPAGTLLALPVHSVHMDEEIYPKAHKFDGFRFLKLREKEGDGIMVARHQLVTTSPVLLGFGLGRHAW